MGVLPDSRITSMVMGADIYTIAQQYDGSLFEYGGYVEAPETTYNRDMKNGRTVADRGRRTNVAEWPKFFTPLAAVSFNPIKGQAMSERYVIYLNDQNILHDQHKVGDSYIHGSLGLQNIKCAHYSSLAAVTIEGTFGRFIGVFYQDPEGDSGAVKMVSFNGPHGIWQKGNANLRDPPLLGTSITAVAPREGILGQSDPKAPIGNEEQPVYYLQQDDNRLASGQGESEPLQVSVKRETSGKVMVFSPHTSLTAVDDKTNMHLVYKSHSGKIKVVRIDKNGVQGYPVQICPTEVTVAPRSAIAASLASPDQSPTCVIVFFYQALDPVTRQVKLEARTAFRATTAANDAEWTTSAKVDL